MHLTHELVHNERRVFPVDRVLRAHEELTVERIAARRLIQHEALVDALRWSRDARETAAELWVDVPMLVVFVRAMTGDERRWVSGQLEGRS